MMIKNCNVVCKKRKIEMAIMFGIQFLVKWKVLPIPISNSKAMVQPAWEIGVGGILILWNVDVVVRPVKAFALTPDFKHLKQTI